jgi:hypothetical protein
VLPAVIRKPTLVEPAKEKASEFIAPCFTTKNADHVSLLVKLTPGEDGICSPEWLPVLAADVKPLIELVATVGRLPEPPIAAGT